MDKDNLSYLGENFYDSDKIKYEDIAPYMLIALHRLGGSAHGKDVVFQTIELMSLNDDVKSRTVKDGKRTAIEIVIRFTMSYLRMAGFLKDPQNLDRGYWGLSHKGAERTELFLGMHERGEDVTSVLKDFRSEYAAVRKQRLEENVQNRQSKSDDSDDLQEDSNVDDSENYDNSTEEDLEVIRSLDPFAFERLCIRVLRILGAEMYETKKSNDGGIDGFGSVVSGLVQFKTVMQAKRYANGNMIQETHIRDFLGAIQAQHAERGIFITTSSYAHKAIELARQHSIVLIDGEELIDKMRENKVGYRMQIDLSDFDTKE